MKPVGESLSSLERALEKRVGQTVKPRCSVCEDVQWVDAPNGETGLVRCECWWESHVERLVRDAAIPAIYEDCRVSNFVVAGMSDSILEARLRTIRWVQEFQPGCRGLLYTGFQGVGKTHLAVAALRAVMTGHRVRGYFVDYGAMLAELEARIQTNASQADVLHPVLHCDVLVVDEIGQRRPTQWAEDVLTTILNERYTRRRTTLFTTNHPDDSSDESLEARVGARVRSRMYQMSEAVPMNGPDYRRQMAQYR